MKLAVFSHKLCWPSTASPTGYATDGGFAFQMRALSELFEQTRLVLPYSPSGNRAGEVPLVGDNLAIVSMRPPASNGIRRKLNLLFWLAGNFLTIAREVRKAEAVHTPVPSDIGAIGMLLAFMFRKPLFVRHCGNWFVQRTVTERFLKWFMEKFAGGRNIMLATGGATEQPSQHNPNLRWIFSTTITEKELRTCYASRDKLPGKKARLIIVCRQEKEKGTGVVIQSLPLLLKKFSEITLDVVGDGRALPEFKSLAASLGINDQVTHGKVNHDGVISLLKRADLFCYPTAASEGFPKVVLEALACGLPVITTQVSVLPKLISTGCGILLEDLAPRSLAKAVEDCLADENLYSLMSSRAIETARQYSLERWRDTIGDLLASSWGRLKVNA